MTLEIEIELDGVCYVLVDNRTRRAVSAPVGIVGILWEEPNVVALAHHDHRDLGLDPQPLARL